MKYTIKDLLVRADTAFSQGQLSQAADLYEVVLCRNPTHDYALYCLGSVLTRMGRHGVGMALLQRSIEENPNRPEALHNLGIGLRDEGHTDAAIKVYEMALEKRMNAQTISNLAGCYINNGTPQKCIELCERGLKAAPGDHSILYHKSLALMELGKLEEGFKLYEHRKHIQEWNPRVYKHPYWDGKPVEWLLIHGEQGVGDEILFMSWLSTIRHLAKNIAIEATPRLVELFKRSFDCPVYPDDKTADQAHPYSAMVAMGSLPIFGGSIPPHGQYLKPDETRVAHYRERLKALGRGPYIGLSWFGGLKKTHTHLRNAEVGQWAGLVRYGTPVSLQYGNCGHEHKTLGIPHWQDAIDNLTEFAALVKALDLVICVNSTPVHFAGALDVPCWTLTPSKPAWRYQIEGDTMPWYRSVRQYRQNGHEWGSVFARIERDLADLCRSPEQKSMIERLAA
jgi:hypothetical protein